MLNTKGLTVKLRAADLFCGAGGTSAGAHATGGVDVTFALNGATGR